MKLLKYYSICSGGKIAEDSRRKCGKKLAKIKPRSESNGGLGLSFGQKISRKFGRVSHCYTQSSFLAHKTGKFHFPEHFFDRKRRNKLLLSSVRVHFESYSEGISLKLAGRKNMAEQQAPDVEMVPASETPPQSQPLAANQVQNEAGGFVWKVDDMERFRRFLVLGSEGGTYYASEKKLGQENAQALLRIIAEGRGPEAVKIIVEYSTQGRTAKQDPIILSLAMCARSSHLETKRAAYAAINQVLRIPTHLFTFVEICETLSKPKSTGWGRAHRKAIQKWYTGKKPRGLAVAVTKYKQRNGWSHRDLFRLCHVKPQDPAIQFIVKYVIKGFDAVQPDAAAPGVGQDITSVCTFLKGVEDAKTMTEDQLVQAIKEHGLVREHIPTNHLNSRQVSCVCMC